jgi:HK97 family phage portal protein
MSGLIPRALRALGLKVDDTVERKTVPLGHASGVDFVGPVIRNSRLTWLNGWSAGDADVARLDAATAYVVSAYCYKAMEWRAQKLAEAPLIVVKVTDEGEEWLPDHRLAKLLNRPRPDVSMREVLQRTSFYRDAGGQCVWVVDRNGLKEPTLVTPFAADEFKSFTVRELIYGRYEVRVADGTFRPRAREDVVHFRDVHPGDWRRCFSRVDAALSQLDLGHTVNRIVRRFLDRAMFPGGVISTDPEWHPTEPEWEQYKEMIDEWYGGPGNSGAPLVVPGGTTFQRSAANVKELLPTEILDRVEATTAAVFGVAPVVLGWLVGLQNSPWSQMGEARRQTYEDTIEPLWRDMAETISLSMLTEEEVAAGQAVRFDTSEVRALQPDEERKARVSEMVSDIWTRGERRLHTGKELLGDERDDEIVGGAQAAPAENLGRGSGGAVGDAADADEEEDGKSADSLDLQWLLFDLNTKAAEAGWVRVVAAHLRDLGGQVAAAAERHLRGAKAEGEQLERKDAPVDPRSRDAFDEALGGILRQSQPRLAAKTYPLIVSTGGAAVRRLGGRIGVSFSVLEPGLLKYARRESAFLADVMGDTTGQAVAGAVQKGLEAGETVRQLADRLRELPEFDRGRAQLTARTETTRAWNGAQRASMSEYRRTSGKRITKTWLDSRDERVRDEHAEGTGVGGETVEVDQAFSNGLMEPGEPNCRCSLVFTVTDGDGEETEVEEIP